MGHEYTLRNGVVCRISVGNLGRITYPFRINLRRSHADAWGERITPMKTLKNLLNRVMCDEAGGEVLEYALIAGLIVVAAIAVIGSVGTKVLARWTSLNNGM